MLINSEQLSGALVSVCVTADVIFYWRARLNELSLRRPLWDSEAESYVRFERLLAAHAPGGRAPLTLREAIEMATAGVVFDCENPSWTA